MGAVSSNISKMKQHKHAHKMHVALWWATEEDSRKEATIAANSRRCHLIYARYLLWMLTSIVLWMNCNNLHLMWKKDMVSLLYTFLRYVANRFLNLCLFWKLHISHHSRQSREGHLYKFFSNAYKSNQVEVHDRT